MISPATLPRAALPQRQAEHLNAILSWAIMAQPLLKNFKNGFAKICLLSVLTLDESTEQSKVTLNM